MNYYIKKPYLLIAGDRYYPSSHTDDWVGCFETYEEAEKEFKSVNEQREYDWHDIVDLREWIN